MRKTELKELYKLMFPDYPDIVTVAQLQQMLGVSRHLAYDLINNGYISGVKIGKPAVGLTATPHRYSSFATIT